MTDRSDAIEKSDTFPPPSKLKEEYFSGKGKKFFDSDFDLLFNGEIWRIKPDFWEPAKLSTFRVRIYGEAKRRDMRIRTSFSKEENRLYVQRIHPPVE